jgi:catechol 2,3-dioxygenase-like lactoylglutathione lyase family enzyme
MGASVGIIPEDRIMLREILHVCIVVRDVEETARAFAERFGIGPWRIRVVHTPTSRASVRGEPVEYTLKFGHSRVGPISLKLVETVEGETIYREFLEEHGEGLHHIGVPTPVPFDAELEKWRRLGIDPLQVNRMEDPEEGWAYMDTQGIAGCILEILSFKRYQ